MNSTEFLYYDGWFSKYLNKPGERYYTFKLALNLFLQIGGKSIVETGCVRNIEDWGAGNSTVLFAEFLSKYGGHLWSIDTSAENLELCAKLTEQYSDFRSFINQDSVVALGNFSKNIDLLYLDSFDYPDGEIVERYTRDKSNKSYDDAMRYLMTLSEEEVLNQYADLLEPCQKHCLNELLAAQNYIHDKTIILLDDNKLPGGGKPRLAKQWLKNNGYFCLLDEKQSTWIRSVGEIK